MDALWPLQDAIFAELTTALGGEATDQPMTLTLADGQVRLTRSESSRWRTPAALGQEHYLEFEICCEDGGMALRKLSTRLTDLLHDADLPIVGHALVDMQLHQSRIERPAPPAACCHLQFKALTVSD